VPQVSLLRPGIRATDLEWKPPLSLCVIPSVPRISYYATPNTNTFAAFPKESRMSFTNAMELLRKFGESRGICISLHPSPMPTEASALKFVIPTEAHPDFLLRGTIDSHVCGFL
jgi:hypothetical protein